MRSFIMRYFILFCLFVCSVISYGQDVSRSLAINIASQYYERVKDDNIDTAINKVNFILQDLYDRDTELISPLGLAQMWLVPIDDGWVLVSSNTKTTPILAHYQQYDKPEYDKLSPAEQFLWNWYEESIAWARDSCQECIIHDKWMTLQMNDFSATNSIATTALTPLLKSKWGQTGMNSGSWNNCDKVYNKFCPEINNSSCNRAAVGCVAVAIGQIMRYWNWPYAANVPITPGGKTTELQFYDWTKMPDEIVTSTPMEEVDMLTSFLRDCGYMVDMKYGEQSSASINNAFKAFEKFGYDKTTIHKKSKLTTANWKDLIINELKEYRPVFYRGQTIKAEGHAFVIDGYDSNGNFHINFGWKGNSDGYFDLDVINPLGYDFKYFQEAIIGIIPNPYCYSTTLDNSIIYPSKFSVTAGGEVILEDKVLENIERGEIYSATQVRLSNGVTIKQGSNVHIAIKDVPCQTSNAISLETLFSRRSNNTTETPTNFSISPNPVYDILTINSTEPLEQINIYNLDGQCVLQTNQIQIDVSFLSQGLYLLKAIDTSGQTEQTKFIKQ